MSKSVSPSSPALASVLSRSCVPLLQGWGSLTTPIFPPRQITSASYSGKVRSMVGFLLVLLLELQTQSGPAHLYHREFSLCPPTLPPVFLVSSQGRRWTKWAGRHLLCLGLPRILNCYASLYLALTNSLQFPLFSSHLLLQWLLLPPAAMPKVN